MLASIRNIVMSDSNQYNSCFGRARLVIKKVLAKRQTNTLSLEPIFVIKLGRVFFFVLVVYLQQLAEDISETISLTLKGMV